MDAQGSQTPGVIPSLNGTSQDVPPTREVSPDIEFTPYEQTVAMITVDDDMEVEPTAEASQEIHADDEASLAEDSDMSFDDFPPKPPFDPRNLLQRPFDRVSIGILHSLRRQNFVVFFQQFEGMMARTQIPDVQWKRLIGYYVAADISQRWEDFDEMHDGSSWVQFKHRVFLFMGK